MNPGDIVTWQKREPGKIYVGLAGCKFIRFAKAIDGKDVAILTHPAFPGEQLVAPKENVHSD